MYNEKDGKSKVVEVNLYKFAPQEKKSLFGLPYNPICNRNTYVITQSSCYQKSIMLPLKEMKKSCILQDKLTRRQL